MRGSILVLAICALSLIIGTNALAEPERPLIVVPGMVGSVLSDSSGKVVWGDGGSLHKSNFVKLDLLPKSGDPVSLKPTDIIRKVPLIFGLIRIGVYSKLLDFLTGKQRIQDLTTPNTYRGNYTEGENLFIFSYDWRRTNFATAKRLNDFIEKMLPNGEYDLVAHSMGGIVTRIMLDGRSPGGICGGAQDSVTGLPKLSREQRNKICNTMYGAAPTTVWPNTEFFGPHPAAVRLHTYIELAVPHRGSNSLVGTFSEGWGALSRILTGGKRTIQNVVLSMPSPMELAPVYERCCAHGQAGASGNKPIANIDAKLDYKLWADKILGFGNQPCPYSNCDARKRILAASLHNRKVIEQIMQKRIPSSVARLYSVVGRDVEGTRETFYLSHGAAGDGKGITYRKNGEGDGTVHRKSALPPEHLTTSKFISLRTPHEIIFDDKSVQKQIYGVILNPLDASISAVSGKIFTIIGAEIRSYGLSIEPAIVLPGDNITLALRMTRDSGDVFDEEELRKVKLIARFERLNGSVGAASATLAYDDAQSFPSDGKILLKGELPAPAETGVYSVKVFDEENKSVISRGQIHVISAE